MKHTEGKWAINDQRLFLHVECDGQSICQISNIEMKDGIRVLSDEWEVENERVSAEKMANAKLIEQAPTMLQALENLCKNIDLSKLNVKKDFELMVAHAEAIKTIHKAKGE